MAAARKKKILFICGSINQTTQMHQIARELGDHELVFAPYYGNRDFDFLKRIGALDATIGGRILSKRCEDYLEKNHLPIEHKGHRQDFDLAFQCSDLVRPSNLWSKKVILVQEGMTDPPSLLYPLYQRLKIGGYRLLPGWVAGTSTFGLSGQYTLMCCASEGYKDEFSQRGADSKKLVVTGIPNFDNCDRYRQNSFPHRGYVLCCTSDTREVFWWEDRKGFIERAVKIANGRQLIFKLHPNEKVARATREIHEWAPGALVYPTGSAEEMVANCDVLICTYSSVAHVGMALGKQVHSFYANDELRRLVPLQNKSAAKNIADVARDLLGELAPGEVARRMADRAEKRALDNLRAESVRSDTLLRADNSRSDNSRSDNSRPDNSRPDNSSLRPDADRDEAPRSAKSPEARA